jgi:hypothetical protein
MRRIMRCVRWIAALTASALLMAACSSGPQASPPGVNVSPPQESGVPHHAAPGPADSMSPTQEHAVSAAALILRRYLDEWASDGPARASRHLVRAQQVTSDRNLPRLVSGTVESVELYRWHGASRFTLAVSMRLRFDGTPMAWTRGENERFVTVRREGRHGRYLLEFATGP